jgi:hypothetical protein
MFLILLTLALLYASGASLMALGVSETLHMGGPGWPYFLWTILASILSYAAVWFARSVPYVICGSAVNLTVALLLRPLEINWVVCLIYSALWFGAASEIVRTYRKAQNS